ncbi:2-polyprenyl-6-methoxyphenol hydroxylase-like FAD-dependent oxidoreductase [Siphonobacter sp. BAB-5404]|nr:2-polyprenyl-6-methoxyphenol hydroxylase-like FAD-dependent oxidoreductase [Siphonobacter sp. SORGH_AS_0500]
MFLDYLYSFFRYFARKPTNTFAKSTNERLSIMKKRMIISGGGIAGLTAAIFLQKQGHEVTILERAKAFTNAGYLLSLKNFGVRIMEELNLAKPLRQAATPSDFMDFVEGQGNLIRRISYEKMNEGMEPSITLTRGDLHREIHQAIKDKVNILMDTCIDSVDQDAHTVRVTLTTKEILEADALIISEGLRSTTREKCFEDSKLEDFNVFYVGGRLRRNHTYQVGSFKTFIDVHKMLSIYPISKDELAIQCYIYQTQEVSSLRQNARQLLEQTFQNYSVEVQTLMADLVESGLVFADKMGMIHAPNLVNGRILLLGDAGYCPTALSGMGASLSIYGAKALAHFMADSPQDLLQAFTHYNALMQPVIEKFQSNARNNAASFLPKDERNLQAFASAFRNASESEAHRRLTDQIILTPDQWQLVLP